MHWTILLAALFGVLLVLFASGMPVAFAFMVVNLLGFFFLVGGVDSLSLLVGSAFESVAAFALIPIPLFILMGELLLRSGLAALTIESVDRFIGRVPGRLSLVTVGAGTVFAALSGSSLATTAMFASTLTPEMERRGYKPPLSIASVLAAGGLAVLIPPSAMAVLLAVLANVSVAKLLIACIVPGLLLAVLYLVYFLARAMLQRHLAPQTESVTAYSAGERLRALLQVLPLTLLILVVTGFIFLGIATPSETAAMGALASALMAAAYGRLSIAALRDSLLATAKVTASLLLIIIGSKAYSQLLAITGVAPQFVQFAVGLPLTPILMVIAMMLIVMVLGLFIDQISIMLITVPVFMPIIAVFGLDPVWFSVCLLINLELAGITPPFGMQLFVMKGVLPKLDILTIYRCALPIVVIQVALIGLIIAYQPIVAWLPSIMLQ